MWKGRTWLGGALLVLAFGAVAEAQGTASIERLESRGCVGCHSVDGTQGQGPTFAGLMGRSVTVRTPEGERTLTVDAEYVRRSIADPDAELVADHVAGSMPRLDLTEAEVGELVEALRTLPMVDPPYQSNLILIASCLFFILAHLVLSSVPVRSRLIGRLGGRGFQGVYSLLVALGFGGIFVGWTYRRYLPLWELGPWTRWVPLVVMPAAFFFLLAGYTTKNPAAAGQESALDRLPRGIVTISRHPALWGFVLWGAAHLPGNGDLASVTLFGTFILFPVLGMLHIDARRAAELGERWAPFATRTSVLPFAAVIRGRARLDVSGLWWRALLAMAVYGLMLLLHEWEVGVSPWPW